MNNYFKQIIILSVALLVASCSFEEADIFPESSAVRLEKAQKEYREILCSAPNGWAMEYFPTASTEGYTLLMKFNTSGKAEMAAKNKYVADKYTTDSCAFQLIADNGPVLSFPMAGNYEVNGTQIGIFHLFSNPEDPQGSTGLNGYGLSGDYEFVVLKADSNLVVLQGKKRSTTIYLRRLAADQSWQGYFEKLDAMNTFLFGSTVHDLSLVLGTDTLNALNGSSHIFSLYPKGGDPVSDVVYYPFIITPTGIRLHTAYALNSKSVQTFNLSADKKLLVGTEDGTAFFTGPVLNKFLYSDLSLWKADLTQMSDNFKSIINDLSVALTVKYNGKRNFEYIGITKKAVYANSIMIRVTGVDATYRIIFTPVAGSADRVNISLPVDVLNLYDTNGKKFYNEVPAIKTTLEAFCGEYVVSTEFPLNVKSVKYTRVDNVSHYFLVNR